MTRTTRRARTTAVTAPLTALATALVSAAISVAVAPAAHAAPTAGPVPAQEGRRCFEASGTHHAKTLVGNTFYKFTHSLSWCTDGTHVVSVDDREHRFTEASAFATFESVIEDSVSRTPAREVTSIKKARVDNCVPGQGCISSKYPFVRLTLRADGTAVPTTGESES
ncbi:hypothetical protein [Pseudonocardia zijingensis]|jgi:hypothetical protein|uniref:Secreted protein n=1 Tax=Pseudonocardia zijingensis TaxID=153376 RepID=A0ABP4AVJ9_9PSEU